MGYTTSTLREQSLIRLLRRYDTLLKKGRTGSRQYSRWRLAIFLSGTILIIGLYQHAWFHTGNSLLFTFLAVFLTVSYFHQRLKVRLDRLSHWIHLKQEQLARLRLDWTSLPHTPYPLPEAHPFALDLDLIGPHSLLRLLDTTFSLKGQVELQHWILQCNQRTVNGLSWHDRQALAKELTFQTRLRDRCLLTRYLKGSHRLDTTRILSLLQQPVGIPSLTALVWGAGILTTSTLLLLGWSLLTSAPHYWLIPLLLYAGLYLFHAGYFHPIFGRTLSLHSELEKLVEVLEIVERTSVTNFPTLRKVCHPIFASTTRPTLKLTSLKHICQALSVKAHPLIHLFLNILLPWDLVWITRLDRLMAQFRDAVPTWISCLGIFDAGCAMGRYAYLHPSFTWPSLETSPSSSLAFGLSASQLGHPLIQEDKRVCNEFSLRKTGTVLLITGSNMSGKSTFLRTVGMNLCLAQAGGPVCASDFSWTWARLSCCIRVTDDLNEGLSYFYAEVKRLKTILDTIQDSDPDPVCFLIDEIYRGTNNRERLLGSEAFVQALQNCHGLGLISTHDLELTQLASDNPSIMNAHFQESIGNGTLQFDYLLRSGPCPTTNALRIMAQEGLPVPESMKKSS